MDKKIMEKRKLLRGYIRLLSQKGFTPEANEAIKYFIIIHNFLGLEDNYYDQIMMNNRQVCNNLDIFPTTSMAQVLELFRKLYSPSHRVRDNIDSMTEIEEVKLCINRHKYQGFYNKLLLKKLE